MIFLLRKKSGKPAKIHLNFQEFGVIEKNISHAKLSHRIVIKNKFSIIVKNHRFMIVSFYIDTQRYKFQTRKHDLRC